MKSQPPPFQNPGSTPGVLSQMSQAALSGGQSLGEGGLLLGGGGNFCLGGGGGAGFPRPCMKPWVPGAVEEVWFPD